MTPLEDLLFPSSLQAVERGPCHDRSWFMLEHEILCIKLGSDEIALFFAMFGGPI